MKKLLLTLFISLTFSSIVRSQGCAANCTLYTQSSIAYSLSPTAGNNLVLGDDQLSGACPIGFTFTFFCTAYTNFYVSSNGFISFNSFAYNGCCGGGILPTAGSDPANLVAFVWTDLYPPAGGTITYTTIGIAPNRVCIISYNNIPYYPGSGSISGQIKLFETSNTIEVHSTSASVDAHIKTQGIENAPGSIGQAPAGRNSVNFSIPSPDAYRWTMAGGGATAPPSILGPASICIGGSYTYSVPVMAGATSYNWTLPAGWSGSSNTNTILATPGATGVLSVSATYTCGTSTTTTLNVTVNPLPVVSIAGGTVPICAGTTITLTANGASTYSWNNGALTQVISISPTVNTTYSVIGTSAAGCTGTAVGNVTVNPAPVVSIAGPTAMCIGGNVNLTANGAVSYTWSNGALSPNISVSPTVNTVYTVIGLSANGCTASASQTVVVNPLPNVTIAGSNTLCSGSVLNLTANGANTYTWNTGANTNTIAPSPTTNVSYTVFGTNTLTGCFNSAAISVTVNSIPTLTVTGPYAMCLNQTITLNAYGAVTYTWSTGGTFSNIAVSPTANISYTVTGSSNLGCAGLPVVKSITVNPIPVVNVNATSSLICKGQSVLITASAVDTYSWNNGALTNTINVTPTVTTSYTVQGTNTTTGCYSNTVITIQVSLCTGLNSFAGNDLKVSVYPNPNSGEFTVELSNGLNKVIEVYDIMGRTVAGASGEDDKIDLNIMALSDGVYYLKIHSDNTIKVIKIVKQ